MSKRQLKKKNPGRTVTKSVSTPEASSSLDLRGQTVEEALMEVDSFLDRAARMHLSQVTIIHGKGTGAAGGRAAAPAPVRPGEKFPPWHLWRRGKRRHHCRAEIGNISKL